MSKNISTGWYSGCDNEKDRATRKGLVLSSTPILEVLKAMLERRKEEVQKVRDEDYNVAGWPYLQAHRNGKMEELDRLINLLGSATDHDG